MFKVIFLQHYYGLGDHQIQYQIIDRTSFRQFLGIHTVAEVPDEKTIWVCKNKLAAVNSSPTSTSFSPTTLVTENPKLLMSTSATEYLGNFIFENGRLDKVLFDGGYIKINSFNVASYHYYFTDHLGSVRVVGDGGGDVEQVNHYYPYGGLIGNLSTNPDKQKYKYNGKEYDTMHGLNTYDYGARQYDGAKIVWDRMDKYCEKYYNINPYVYCARNPVRFIDPDGCEIKGYTKKNAAQAVEDIRAIFAEKEFDNFRNLIVQSGKKQNGKSLAKISDDALKTAFNGVNLSEDQQALVDIVVNTINSDNVHTIEYADKDGIVSNDAKDAFNPIPEFNGIIEMRGGLPTFLIQNAGGGGLTMRTFNGTHTVIVNHSSLHPLGRSVTTGHELFGHGRSLGLGRSDAQQHIDAIQAENLIRRVMGITSVNDGSHHADGTYISNPTSLPKYR